MRKTLAAIIVIIILLLITATAIYFTHFLKPKPNNPIKSQYVSYNGWLHTSGSKLQNDKGENIQLRGLSSHGIEWFSDVITKENLEVLKNDWGINVFRIAMYTDSNKTEYKSGYIYDNEKNKQKVYEIADMAINLDMYVIIDWHILDDKNPQTHINEAKKFFDEVSLKYADTPNVIYEICNEPNGEEVTWKDHIKPYAETIIPVIRKNSPKSLIIVGTPYWCTGLNSVVNNPLNFENVTYSCHFYSGTHTEDLRKTIAFCLKKDIPIFISECGVTKANGDGDVFFDEFTKWIKFLNSNNLSWVCWSFSNKNESSAILVPEFEQNDGELNDFLTETGKFIKSICNFM